MAKIKQFFKNHWNDIALIGMIAGGSFLAIYAATMDVKKEPKLKDWDPDKLNVGVSDEGHHVLIGVRDSKMNLGIAMPFNAETTANIINDMTDCLHAVKRHQTKG